MNEWISRERFSLHPGVRMAQRMILKIEEHLGEPRDSWRHWLERYGVSDRKMVEPFLREKLKMGTNQARLFAEVAFEEYMERYDASAYFGAVVGFIEQQYSGKKEALRPIYTQCIKQFTALGTDVRFSPCKTFVPVYRKRVIAQIFPASQTRIHLGFSLGDTPATQRLLSTGGFKKGDRITHKIKIESLDDLDDQVWAWAQQAYEMDS